MSKSWEVLLKSFHSRDRRVSRGQHFTANWTGADIGYTLVNWHSFPVLLLSWVTFSLFTDSISFPLWTCLLFSSLSFALLCARVFYNLIWLHDGFAFLVHSKQLSSLCAVVLSGWGCCCTDSTSYIRGGEFFLEYEGSVILLHDSNMNKDIVNGVMNDSEGNDRVVTFLHVLRLPSWEREASQAFVPWVRLGPNTIQMYT